MLTPEIKRVADFFDSLKSELDGDVSSFKKNADDAIRQDDHSQFPSDAGKLLGIQQAYKDFLDPWVEARARLSQENDDYKIKVDARKRRSSELISQLGRINRIQKVYFYVENVAPVLFAFVAIIWILHINRHIW